MPALPPPGETKRNGLVVETHLIETFVEVVQRGSVTAAARALDRSQPAISHRLKQLELAFGTPLFEKVGRELQLTAAGWRLHAEAVAILARLRALPQAVSPSGALRGQLKIGVPDSLADHAAHRLIRAVNEYPDLRIQLECGPADELIAALGRGQIDAAVLAPADDPGLVYRRWPGVTMQAIIRGGGGLTATDLVGERYLEWSADEPMASATRSVASALGLDPVLRATHVDVLQTLVSGGAGFAILPSFATQTAMENDEVDVIELAAGAPVKLSVAMRADRAQDPVLEYLFELLRPD